MNPECSFEDFPAMTALLSSLYWQCCCLFLINFCCIIDDTSTCLSTHTKICSICHQACTGSALVHSLSIFVVLQMIHLPVYQHIQRFVASVIKLLLAVLLFIHYQFFVVLQKIHLPVYQHIRRFVASVIKLVLAVLLFIPYQFLLYSR